MTFFYTDDLIDKPMEKNGWAMSVATRGVRGEVGTPTTLWSPPGMISHTDRQA